jgi:peptidoglycan hydrolase CwlO-like protein
MENKKTKAPAIKAPKVNPEIEQLKDILDKKEAINKELLENVKFLETQIQELHVVASELWNEIDNHRKAGFFAKLKNLF